MVIFNVFLSAGAGRVVSASATLLALATPVYSDITIWPGRPYTCPAFFASQLLSFRDVPPPRRAVASVPASTPQSPVHVRVGSSFHVSMFGNKYTNL